MKTSLKNKTQEKKREKKKKRKTEKGMEDRELWPFGHFQITVSFIFKVSPDAYPFIWF